jgi:hypothetical protein
MFRRMIYFIIRHILLSTTQVIKVSCPNMGAYYARVSVVAGEYLFAE